MAKTAKEKLFDALIANKWVQDPRARKTKDRSARREDELIVDRNFHLRPAADGGQWRIKLQWTNAGGSWNYREGDRLLKTHVYYVAPDTEYATGDSGYDHTSYELVGTLENAENDRWASVLENAFWDTLKWNGKDGTVGTYRQAVDQLIKDPDTAIWLVREAVYKENERRKRETLEAEELRKLKARHLPIIVPQKGYGSEWNRLIGNLESATRGVKHADGTSDLPQLVADASKALQDIVEVLTPEALERMGEIIGERIKVEAWA